MLFLTLSSSTNAAVGVTFTVDSTGDGPDASVGNGICATDTGACTLRAAIQESNFPNGSNDTIAFNILSIAPATELPVITDPVVIDGTTHPSFVDKPIVELKGDALAAGSRGIRILAGDTTVRGLVVNRFSDQIVVGVEGAPQVGDGVRIVGNYLGTDLTGTSAAGGNGNGIRIIGGSDHVIGGPDPADRNVISGNGFAGIGLNAGLDGPGKVTIQGNLIGTNASGDAAVTGSGISTGINSLSPGLVLIGGAAPGEGNVISGSGAAGQGIRLLGGPRHRVVGNKIGTDVDGENAVPNGNGILTSSLGAGAEIIDNVVSGNRGVGVELQGDVGSVVQGNKIGVDVDGLERLPNADGIYLTGTTGVLVGGTTPASRNIISANGIPSSGFGSGIHFFNQASRNTIQGNLIGVGADGRDLGNTGTGIFCCGTFTTPPGNVVGGTAEGAGNVIAFNDLKGILVLGFTGPRVSILGNSIYSNTNLGIDLSTDGPTPNDLSPPCASPPGPDCDTGPNDFQNFPVIGAITSGGGQTVATTAFNSTPDTEFRLEFFRSTSCNEPPPSFSWFFGQGQTLVGTRNLMTDSAGNWSGQVTLAGETTPTEVITATATRFTEPGATLAGSTSEFSECLADLAIMKTDEPDPVAAGGSLTYTIDVVNDGPAPATSVRVTDTLPPSVTVTSVTPSQGSCSPPSGSTVTCELGSIARDGTARVTIVLNPGTAVRLITNTARVTSEPRDPDPSDNSATATTQIVTGGSLVVRKVTVPSPDASNTSFAFTAGGGLSPASFTLKNGASRTFGDLVPRAGYGVAETPPAGWDLTSSCDDGSPVSNIDIGPGETVTCTFTNTKRGSVTLKKTTNGVVDPSKDILFVLTGQGLPSAGVSRSTFGDQDGVLEFGTGNLIPGQTYKICETPVPAGFTSFWKLDGVIITPYNPDASRTPPEDLGTRCYDFQVFPGQARAFEVDNSRPGGDPRTIGYWKNWNRCTSGNQAATAEKNGGAAAGFFLVEDLLPQPIGDFNVTSCQQAVKLLSKQDQSGKSKSSDAAYELGSQLLAARFNLAAGAETCLAAQQAVLDGQTLLDGINFSGSGDYLGSKSKDARRAQALALAAALDRYNNGDLC